MTNGTIKFFNAAKGFGFITPEDGGKDVFVPAASVTASGLSGLKPGQTVSFDTEPDSKGPKAVNLKLVAEPPKPVRPVPAPQARDAEQARITVYHDPACDESRIVLAALGAAGQDPHLVDYIATPPSRDELKNLSLLLRGGDQSLVRKYDPMFLELRLDDRFISDGEFWGAIVEHPSLINGPILATAHKARVCRTENAVKSFLGIDVPDEPRKAPKPKGLPQNMAAAVRDDMALAKKEEEPSKAEPTENARPKASAVVAKKPLIEVRAKIKPNAKIEAVSKMKKTVKPAKPVKKPAPKPVKKAGRAKKT